jgi:hypothetical protein
VTDHGLFIKFRSYLNHHFSDQDVTVVFLPYSKSNGNYQTDSASELPP